MYGPDSYLDGIKCSPGNNDFIKNMPLLGAIPRVVDELFKLLNQN